jgi:hypothetical protein
MGIPFQAFDVLQLYFLEEVCFMYLQLQNEINKNSYYRKKKSKGWGLR